TDRKAALEFCLPVPNGFRSSSWGAAGFGNRGTPQRVLPKALISQGACGKFSGFNLSGPLFSRLDPYITAARVRTQFPRRDCFLPGISGGARAWTAGARKG